MPFCFTGCEHCRSRGRSALGPTAGSQGPCAAPQGRTEPTPSGVQSTAPFAPCHVANLPTAHAGDRGCPQVRTAPEGLPCWRPTACTEHRHRSTEGTKNRTGRQPREGELLESGQGRARRGGCHSGQAAVPGWDPCSKGSTAPAAAPGSRTAPHHPRGSLQRAPFPPRAHGTHPPPGSAATPGAEVSGGLACQPLSSV